MLYTVLMTSCNRPELLKKTVESFKATCGIEPFRWVIVDDRMGECPDYLQLPNVKWIKTDRKGQVSGADILWDHCYTEYAFWLEEDWCFRKPGYLQESLDILEKYPDIFQVWLRGIPTEYEKKYSRTIYNVKPHPVHPLQIAQYHWGGWEGGFSFNPGLRRLSDYHRLGNYGRHVGYDPRGCGEKALGIIYHKLGYSSAILAEDYVYHTGDESHVDRKVNPLYPKILVAIPTADSLDYSRFREMQLRTWDRQWLNGVSGLQVDGRNLRREAVEATWFRDCSQFSNVECRFFTLPGHDDHVSMPHKMRFICQQMLASNADVLFRPDDDTYVDVSRMVRQGVELSADYAGVDQGGFVIGGPGIWMSRRACEIVAASTPPDYRKEWRDDAWMGQVLKSAGIPLTDLPMTIMEKNVCLGPIISRHPCGPEEMRKRYAELGIPPCISDRP